MTRRVSAIAQRSASTLVLADHTNGALSAPTLATVSAAVALGQPVSVLVAGKSAGDAAAAAAKVAGVDRVLHAEHDALEHQLPETLAPLVVKLQADHSFTHVLGSASSVAKNVLPRVAALLDVSQVSEVVSIVDDSTFTRPVYAGNAIATVKSSDSVKVLTVRSTAFDKAAEEGGSASVDAVDAGLVEPSSASAFDSVSLKESDRPDLTSAKVVVAGGRALKDAETFSAQMEPLATSLNAAIGASRAAVDAGFCPNDMQVGQTGKIVAPDLYIAVGISGAIQHVAGMKDSKVIVAINKDEEAPIYALSDYWLVGDLYKVLPELNEKIAAAKK